MPSHRAGGVQSATAGCVGEEQWTTHHTEYLANKGTQTDLSCEADWTHGSYTRPLTLAEERGGNTRPPSWGQLQEEEEDGGVTQAAPDGGQQGALRSVTMTEAALQWPTPDKLGKHFQGQSSHCAATGPVRTAPAWQVLRRRMQFLSS